MAGRFMLHESFVDSPSLKACSREAELYWPRIIAVARDGFGCFPVNYRVITAKAFPDADRWRGITESDVARWLGEYAAAGMLQVWESDGRTYGYWLGWFTFNRMDSRLKRQTPEPPEYLPGNYPVTTGEFPHSGSGTDSNTDSNTTTIPVTTRRRKTESGYTADFLAFWQAYPKRTGKGAAAKAWAKAKPPLPDVLASLSWQIHSEQWTKDGGQFVPLPATYLNQRRWEDEPAAPAEVPATHSKPLTKTEEAARCRKLAMRLPPEARDAMLREAETIEGTT